MAELFRQTLVNMENEILEEKLFYEHPNEKHKMQYLLKKVNYACRLRQEQDNKKEEIIRNTPKLRRGQ